MTVAELIDLLKKCPQDSLVMYSMANAIENEDITIMDNKGGVYSEEDFSVDDCVICSGTLQGFVLLTADLLPTNTNKYQQILTKINKD